MTAGHYLKLILFSLITSNLNTSGLSGQSGTDSIYLETLNEKVNYWYYNNFDSVLKFSNDIISAAGKDGLIDKQLESIFLIFTCGANFNRVPESYPYLELATQIINGHGKQIEKIDSTGYQRASLHFLYALFHYYMGNYSSAIDEFSTATNTCNDSDLIGSAFKFIGQAYYSTGNYDKSIHYFRRSDEYIQNPGNKGLALNLMYEGEYFFALGNTARAFKNFRKALKLLETEKGSDALNSLKSINMLIAGYYLKNEQYDSAIIYTGKRMKYQLDNDPDYTDSYNFLADAFYKQNLIDSAFKYYNKGLLIANAIHKESHYIKYKSLLGIANIYRDEGNYEKALKFYNESLKNLPHSLNGNKRNRDLPRALMPVETMSVLVEKARLFISWYNYHKNRADLDSAIINLRKAIILNDFNRKELLSIESKETKSEVQFNITDLGLQASFQAFNNHRKENDQELLFMFMEKSKANILLDEIEEDKAREFSGVPSVLIDKESRLKGELSYYKNSLLSKTAGEKDYEIMTANYNRKLKEYIDVIDTLEKEYAKYYSLKYSINTVTLDDLKTSLPRNSLLIEYAVSNDKIYVAAVSKKNIVIKAIDRNAEFDQNLSLLLKQISNPNLTEIENEPSVFKEFTEASSYIYDKLIAPVLHMVHPSISRLIIIPEGALCYLPFELLLTRNNIAEGYINYKDLPYLIKEYSISYDYSSTLWMENLNEKPTRLKTYIGYAPGDFINAHSLVASKNEVETCSGLWHGSFFTGARATETSIKRISLENCILHLATHTILNDEDPQKSSFSFALDRESKDDGLLFTYEIYNMSIPAKLAILSGCETGIGHIRNGEGIISLARAFKYAGCQNIIMSLWKVNDLATKDIMIEFNRNLKKGMHKGKALRKAKLFYIINSGKSHPAYWSSFVLIGNDTPVRRNYTLYFLIPILLVVLVFSINRKNILKRLIKR